jgi:hypothetical protein
MGKEIWVIPERNGKNSTWMRVSGTGFISLESNFLNKTLNIYPAQNSVNQIPDQCCYLKKKATVLS